MLTGPVAAARAVVATGAWVKSKHMYLIRGGVGAWAFIFTHPPEDKKKKKLKYHTQRTGVYYQVRLISPTSNYKLRWVWYRYPSVRFLIMHVLVVTRFLSCVEIGCNSFIPFFVQWTTEPRLVPRPETNPNFPSKIRRPSNTNAIPIPVSTGNYRPFKDIRGKTVTQSHDPRFVTKLIPGSKKIVPWPKVVNENDTYYFYIFFAIWRFAAWSSTSITREQSHEGE